MDKNVRRAFNALGLSISSLRTDRIKDGRLREIDDLFDFTLARNGGGVSMAQNRQDIFALIANGFKRNGCFVEFGAANGKDMSNTHLLEKQYGWSGILAEPATMWHSDLKKNRSCSIETDCVWRASGETLSFDMAANGELSTISSFSNSDNHSRFRQDKATYPVQTISLLDLLEKHQAPEVIDFMSVDTEGSELEILQAFDFSKHLFNAITIEHNFMPNRDLINRLLIKNGYRRVFQHYSSWDDWFVPL